MNSIVHKKQSICRPFVRRNFREIVIQKGFQNLYAAKIIPFKFGKEVFC